MKLEGYDLNMEIQGSIHMQDAPDEAVRIVLSTQPDDPEGRSQWLWVRFPNGDLMLGCFPQGDTYFATEKYRDL